MVILYFGHASTWVYWDWSKLGYNSGDIKELTKKGRMRIKEESGKKNELGTCNH